MTLSSDEVNFLIYRYLLESGFVHSAFAFGHESHIAKSSIEGEDVPPGALVSFIQKGLQYDEIESHINTEGVEVFCDEPFSVLKKHTCKIKSKKKLYDPDVPMDEDFGLLEGSSRAATFLRGHKDYVYQSAWSPSSLTLATCSEDNTICLWDTADLCAGSPTVCTHDSVSGDASKNCVFTIAWNHDGSRLAAGTAGGFIHLWDAEGTQRTSIAAHAFSIMSLAWSPDGAHLLSCGVDRKVIVWSADVTTSRRTYQQHEGAVLALAWKDKNVFASCSQDASILVCDIREELPIKKWSGHNADVNVIKWDIKGKMLASASDDGTICLWNVGSDEPVQRLEGHCKDVVDLDWVNGSEYIASASLDTTVKLWSVHSGKCVLSLDRHVHPVIRVLSSPTAHLLASIANDRLYIWDVKEGSLLRTYKCRAGINDLDWDKNYNRIALSLADHTVSVIDVQR